MGADISRSRFDPDSDHSGVVLQQGRLLLDADWNELVDILSRRLRAAAADLGSAGPSAGIAGVAVVPRTTPDAFGVTLSGGALSIGRGRMYVDGLLAENHGTGPVEFDPLLAEERGTLDTPYEQQPYWPEPASLPSTGAYLAYLDVWEREVTSVENPGLIDPAIGVDTTARTQVAWQVRLHPLDGAAVTCSSPDADIPGWTELIAPSGGRLTVDTIEVDDEDDECPSPPTGGYRGPENQFFRVEIHDGGQPGTATFTWSRDNGSVLAAVEEVLPGATGIRPEWIKRDDVLGFHDLDWVEITDDHRELAGERGVLRRIDVDEIAGTITFDDALPGDLTLSVDDAKSRHLRVRRWDQKGLISAADGSTVDNLDLAGATGVITVPASAATRVVLERGVVVSFSSVGPAFRPGDHWEFAARVADTSVEEFVAAPPRGVHHHYARLGVLTFPSTATDCRTPWPDDCGCESGCTDCTVCVTPESHASGELTIQMAIDQVRDAGGGTVCLSIGTFHLDEKGVQIDRCSSLRVRGQGVRTALIASYDGIQVSNSAFITVDNLTVITRERAAVRLRTTAAVTLERLTTLVLGTRDLPTPAITFDGVTLLTKVRDNVVVAQHGIGGVALRGEAVLTGELDISDNTLVCRDIGIGFGGSVAHVLAAAVTGNSVLRADAAGIRLHGAILPGAGATVTANAVHVGGVGIEVGAGGYSVAGNRVEGTVLSVESRSDGISVVPVDFAPVRGATTIRNNRVRDVGGRGIAALAAVTSLVVSGNLVERAGHGIVMEQRARAGTASVVHNSVTEIGSREQDRGDASLGIQALGVIRVSVESNTVDGVGTVTDPRGDSVGINVVACADSRVSNNTVHRIGFVESGASEVGIRLRGGIRRSLVHGNSVRRQLVDVDDDGPSSFQGLLIGADADPVEFGGFASLGWVFGSGSLGFAIGPLTAFAVRPGPASVTVDANIISGSAELPTVLVGVFGDVVVSGNQLHTRLEGPAPALRVLAIAATVGNNRLRGGRPSAQLEVDPSRLAVLGNLTSDQIFVQGGPLTMPWIPLNPSGV